MGPHHALHYAVSSPGRHYYHSVFLFISDSDGVYFFSLPGEMETFTLETL